MTVEDDTKEMDERAKVQKQGSLLEDELRRPLRGQGRGSALRGADLSLAQANNDNEDIAHQLRRKRQKLDQTEDEDAELARQVDPHVAASSRGRGVAFQPVCLPAKKIVGPTTRSSMKKMNSTVHV